MCTAPLPIAQTHSLWSNCKRLQQSSMLCTHKLLKVCQGNVAYRRESFVQYIKKHISVCEFLMRQMCGDNIIEHKMQRWPVLARSPCGEAPALRRSPCPATKPLQRRPCPAAKPLPCGEALALRRSPCAEAAAAGGHGRTRKDMCRQRDAVPTLFFHCRTSGMGISLARSTVGPPAW